MKVTAVYMKLDANPFKCQAEDYRRISGYIPAGVSDELMGSYAREAAPEGYIFVCIERGDNQL